MKWFKHESDASTNLKLEQVLDEFGLHGYGFFWLCLELVAGQGGLEFKLKPEKNWKKALMKKSNLNEDRTDKILVRFGELNLIDKKALKRNILYIPKLAERADEYTVKLRSKSGQYRDNVGLEQNRIEKKRIEQTPQAAMGTNFNNFKTKNPGADRKKTPSSFQSVGEMLKKKAGIS